MCSKLGAEGIRKDAVAPREVRPSRVVAILKIKSILTYSITQRTPTHNKYTLRQTTQGLADCQAQPCFYYLASLEEGKSGDWWKPATARAMSTKAAPYRGYGSRGIDPTLPSKPGRRPAKLKTFSFSDTYRKNEKKFVGVTGRRRVDQISDGGGCGKSSSPVFLTYSSGNRQTNWRPNGRVSVHSDTNEIT